MRRAKRRKKRGVALLESLIAISALTILFGGVVYFHSVYAAKSRALGVARTEAWLATQPGACDGESQTRSVAVAAVPQMFSNGVANASLSVNAGSSMSCNVKATELKSTLEVVTSVIGTIGDQF